MVDGEDELVALYGLYNVSTQFMWLTFYDITTADHVKTISIGGSYDVTFPGHLVYNHHTASILMTVGIDTKTIFMAFPYDFDDDEFTVLEEVSSPMTTDTETSIAAVNNTELFEVANSVPVRACLGPYNAAANAE